MTQNLKSKISVSDALSASWKSVMANIWPLAGFTFLYFLVTSMLNRIPGVSFFTSFLGFIYPVSMFYAFRAIDSYGSLSFNDLFNWTPRFWRMLGAYAILLLIVLVLCIPVFITAGLIGVGIITDFFDIVDIYETVSWSTILTIFSVSLIIVIPIYILQFSYLFIVCFRDQNLGDVIKLSWQAGITNIGSLLLIALVALGIALLGMLALFVGLLVAIPVIIGMQYYFLKSIFPIQDENNWDFQRQ